MSRPIFVIALIAAATLPAQDLVPKAPPQGAPIVLTNAVLHTVTGGIVLGGTLWFQDGVIKQVLPADAKPELPAGAEPVVFDLRGKHVFPGMISAHTTLGLIEIGSVRQTNDTDEVGDLSPEAIAAVSLNPDSTAIPVARSNGVLAAAVFPSGGLLPGRASVIQLDGWTNRDLAVQADAGPVVAWPAQRSGERRGRRPPPGPNPEDATARGETDGADAVKKARQRIDEAFVRAREWVEAKAADPSVPLDVRHAALAPALRGEVPVFVLADDQEQIESAIHWATKQKLRCVIVGGRAAAECATLLLDRQVPVILDGVHLLPRRDDSDFDEPFTLPARLSNLGVKFCIATGADFSFDRNLPYHAATASAFGLDAQRALAAITQDAADILGVGKRLGSLTPGKDATLFVADGHPFDLPTKIEMAFVGGRQIDLRNKQTELAKKYRERYRQLEDR